MSAKKKKADKPIGFKRPAALGRSAKVEKSVPHQRGNDPLNEPGSTQPMAKKKSKPGKKVAGEKNKRAMLDKDKKKKKSRNASRT